VADANLLFTAHRDGIFRYLTRLVGQAEAARDLTQEVFLRVARGPVPVATEVEHRAWVFKIARNLALNHLRDARRQPETVLLADAATPATQELGVALQQALDALPAPDRDVFLLRESGGLSYDEIATACDLTADAVRMRLHRARTALRASLAAPLAGERARGIRLAPPGGIDRP
jgi:RNA polymerase sigma-70 factor (ECF subfamily)